MAISATTGEPANQFLATPNGSAGAVGLRGIAAADLPTTGLTIAQCARPITVDTISGGAWTPNLGVTDWHQATLNANTTVSSVTSPSVGQTFYFRAIQAASGGPYTLTFSFGTITWLTSSGTAPGMSTGAGSVSVFAFVCTATGQYDGYLCGPGSAIGAGSITYADIQNESASTILGNPTGSAAAPSEISLYPNMGFVGSNNLRSRVPLASVIGSGTAVANTTTQTSLFTGATLQGSLVIPANTLVAGSHIGIGILCTYGAGTTSSTLKWVVLLGGNVIGSWTSNANTTSISGNMAGLYDSGFGWTVKSVGSSGTILGACVGNHQGGTFGAAWFSNNGTNPAPTAVTINTTASLTFDVQVAWSVANSANTIQLLGGAVFID